MTLRQRRKPIIPADIVREFDAFVKVENDFKQPTTTGGTSIKKILYFLFLQSILIDYLHFSFNNYHYCCSFLKFSTYRYISN